MDAQAVLAVLKTAAVPATLVLSYLALRYGRGFYGFVQTAVSKVRAGSPATDDDKARPQPTSPAACASTLAEHFAHLREHYRKTGQADRVAVMDDRLAAGLFVTEGEPHDLIHLRIAETPEEV